MTFEAHISFVVYRCQCQQCYHDQNQLLKWSYDCVSSSPGGFQIGTPGLGTTAWMTPQGITPGGTLEKQMQTSEHLISMTPEQIEVST